jgi:hypothetical protein
MPMNPTAQIQQAIDIKNHAKAHRKKININAERDEECGPCQGCPEEEACGILFPAKNEAQEAGPYFSQGEGFTE